MQRWGQRPSTHSSPRPAAQAEGRSWEGRGGHTGAASPHPLPSPELTPWPPCDTASDVSPVDGVQTEDSAWPLRAGRLLPAPGSAADASRPGEQDFTEGGSEGGSEGAELPHSQRPRAPPLGEFHRDDVSLTGVWVLQGRRPQSCWGLLLSRAFWG